MPNQLQTSMRVIDTGHYVTPFHEQKSFRNDLPSVSTNRNSVPPHSAPVVVCRPSNCAQPARNKRAMKTERLSESQVFELVKIYKEYECLWDVTNENYKNRQVRDNAYKEMLEKLNIPKLKVTDIPQKIKNLRTSYYTELKKIEYSIKSGGKLYKPKVAWFSIADQMLRNISSSQLLWNPNETETTIEPAVTETQKDDTEKELVPIPEPIAKKPKKVETQKLIATLDKIATKTTPAQNEPQTKNEPQTINEPQTKNEDDEFDVYGKYIAISLRSMPREMSIIARMELQKTLADVQLKILRQKNGEKRVRDGPSTSKMEEDPLEDTIGDVEDMEQDFAEFNVKIEDDNDL